jgi:hypothetical protein
MFKFFPRRTERQPRSDKKIPVQPSLTRDTHDKLYKLAISCNMTKTKMAEQLIHMSVNHPDIIEHYQKIYNTEPMYRIVPVIDQDGKVEY